MRIALAQINPTVGDIAHNVRKIVDFALRAKTSGARIAVFPELCVTGYPPKDLLLKQQFIEDNIRGLDIIAHHARGIDVIVGYAERNPQPLCRSLY
jgi:NAD+ synthase (glutamine-hydrolysing)